MEENNMILEEKMNYNNLKKVLILPIWLYYDREDEILLHATIQKDNVVRIKETYMRYHSLYETIEIARYNLLISYNENIIEELSKESDRLWVKTLFVKNALQWYNASFDILLQCLWLYYGIYQKNVKKKYITTKNIPTILRDCNYIEVNKYLKNTGSPLTSNLKKLNSTISKIRDWTNSLKHRGETRIGSSAIETVEIMVTKSCDETAIMYDSKATRKDVTIEECVNDMVTFHKELIQFSKKMTEDFHLFFK